MNWLVHLGVVKEYEQADRDKDLQRRKEYLDQRKKKDEEVNNEDTDDE